MLRQRVLSNFQCKIWSLILIGILQSNGVLADSAASLRHITIADGLPSMEVYQSMQMSGGAIWFATDRGLCRYNGTTFTTYTRKDGLPDEVVFGFHHHAATQRLWFYTYKGGLGYIEEGKIQVPAFNDSLRSVLRKNRFPIIVSMHIDGEGTLWLGTKRELVIQILASGVIQTMFEKASEDPSTHVLHFEDGCVFTGGKLTRAAPFSQFDLVQIASGHRMIYQTPSPGIDRNLQHAEAKVLALGSTRYLMAFGNRLIRFNSDTIVQTIDLPSHQEILYALLEDTNGGIWVGTTKGVLRFPDTDLSKRPQTFLHTRAISSVWQDHEGGFWFTTLHDGVYYLPNLNMASYSFDTQGQEPFLQILGNKDGIYGLGQHTLSIFEKGKLSELRRLLTHQLVGNYRLLACRDQIEFLAPHSAHLIDALIPSSVKFPDIDCDLHQNDENEGLIWGRKRQQLFFWEDIEARPILSVPFDGDKIICAAYGKNNGELWAGTAEGLLRYDEGGWKNLGDIYHQFSRRISDLDFLRPDILLITTRGSGIWLMDLAHETAEKVKGLPNEYCNQSLVESDGTVWVASFSGVSKIRGILTTSPQLVQFTRQNGLISDAVQQITVYQEEIWALTRQGLSKWPRNWEPLVKVPPVVVDQIHVNGQRVSDAILDHLSYAENHLSFFFEAVGFQRPIHYQYRLEGLHDNWIATTDQQADYSGLEAGSYQFQLRTSAEDAIQANIPVYITPPFWLNPGVIGLGLGIILLTLGLFLFYRHQSKRRENKLYQLFIHSEQKALRAQMNPHFMFNSFSSMLEMLLQKEYHHLQKYMQAFAGLTRLFLECSRQESISLQQEIDLLEQYMKLECMRAEKRIDAHIELGPGLNPKEIFLPSLLLQPYVENAFKHGVRSREDMHGQIIIRFKIAYKQLLIEIQDNGKGMTYTRIHQTRRNASLGMKINNNRVQYLNMQHPHQISVGAAMPEDPVYPGTMVKVLLPLQIRTQYETSSSYRTRH
ncbi:MAG: histidine kinase [Bacteroidota bacterium]